MSWSTRANCAFFHQMNTIRSYTPIRATTPTSPSHETNLPGTNFNANDMLEWLSLDGWERVREIQVSGQGEDHGHLRHCVIEESMTVITAMERYFAVPADVGRLLVRFGAVHCARIPPEIPAAMLSSPEEGAKHDAVRQRARQMVIDGRELEGLSQSQQSRILLSKTDRILDETFVAKPLSYIRAHLWPKRFPLFYSVDWRDRVVAVGDEYVVVNKPSGVPVPSTVDNVLENVQSGAAKALGVDVETIHITSRIDQPTEGLVVVGRSKAFVGRFNAAMRSNVAKKFYRAAAWVDNADALEGALAGFSPNMDVRHRVLVQFKVPGSPFVTLVCDDIIDTDCSDSVQNTLVECHMVVRSVRALGDDEHRLQSGGRKLVEFEIELVTGRTHQIRCQLSAMGLPLIGDDMYGPLADRSLRARLLADRETFQNVLPDGTRVLREPEVAIGLQAFRLEFEGSDAFQGERTVFEAGTPWWRDVHPRVNVPIDERPLN